MHTHAIDVKVGFESTKHSEARANTIVIKIILSYFKKNKINENLFIRILKDEITLLTLVIRLNKKKIFAPYTVLAIISIS